MIGARATFCAGHKLPQHEEVHGHSYVVWAYTDTWGDAEAWQKFLQSICAKFDHRMLGPDLGKMEQLAEVIGQNTMARRVEIKRPVEGLCCEWESGAW